MGGRARILLVDDRPENLVALEAILSPLNQVLVPVRSGKQALAELSTEDYAVVLLDVMMPAMDGFETADRIRRTERNRDVPIIFLTAASTRPESTFRGYTAGAVDYLAKPFDPWVLTAKVTVFVELYLKAQRRAEELSRSIEAVEEAAAQLARTPAAAADPQTQDALARLARRISQLSEALRDNG